MQQADPASSTSDRQIRPETSPQTDIACLSPIAAAWAAYRNAAIDWALQPPDLADGEEEEFYRRIDRADDQMIDNASTSIADVAMKLRRAFIGICGPQWKETLALGTPGGSAERQLHGADYSDRLLWAAIKELEALGGTGC